MISDARRGHVSPGIYTEEKDVQFSVKSLGITSLGLVGETLYGPAFQNVEVSKWSEFIDYFGGTSAEKFENGNLKYELPYVAKSYLEESNRLNVVRVLGLSGYEAGPAWVLLNNSGQPIMVLRSNMTYSGGSNKCDSRDNESASEIVEDIRLVEYTNISLISDCSANGGVSGVSAFNKVGIEVTCKNGFVGSGIYYVSFNPGDNDYIYNVISSKPNGRTPIYIDAIYESNIDESGVTSASTLTPYSALTGITKQEWYKVVECTAVSSGDSRYSAATAYKLVLEPTYKQNGGVVIDADKVYAASGEAAQNGIVNNTCYYSGEIPTNAYICINAGTEAIDNYYTSFNEGYRAAQTPWILSEAAFTSEGESEYIANIRKLFRFITISDGDAANTQVKVSIQNINVANGVFDVVVRDFFDTDANPLILEAFTKCNLVEGDANYIAYRIGSIDGGFVAKSKYILVEMAEGEDFANSIPSGFLGYPMPKYSANTSEFNMNYNTEYKPEIKARKQYFGFSNNVDRDIFKYKGFYFYDEEPEYTTKGFHMDAALYKANSVKVDNITGYCFDSVSSKMVMGYTKAPRLVNNDEIEECLYKDIKTRKFTVCFYGGFDGWDVNRTGRTNTDKFKSTNYKAGGSYKEYSETNDLNLPLNLPSTAITSDYYAYLAGCRIFANPQDIDINLFATPGINWGDHALLTQEIIDIIEDAEDGRGGDALYVTASPNSNDVDDVVLTFEGAGVNSSYACTYFPWVMYYDASNKKYLNIPATKDVIRNMAAVDNNSYPWFAPAGTERGKVNCVKATFKTRLSDEDTLYEAGINPIKSFAQDGVIIWGNKTTYPVDSPINRINVRRMMIRVKKLIMESAKHLIFEQYDETLEKQFKGIVEPILADVKSNRGIIDYRVITESTPETRDQHILPAKILIKPTQSLEYVSISFTVYPESVQFEE